MKKVIRIIALIMSLTFVLCSCSNASYTSSTGSDTTSPAENIADNGLFGNEETDDYNSGESTGGHPQVKFTMENGGSFVMELYPEYAPKTVENFMKLVSEGFYNGLTFHRIVDDFMAQGGCPEGTGMGGSSMKIKGEFALNGFEQNTLSHTRGVVSMARSSSYNSASSQFFIMYSDNHTYLDGQYAAFGKVISGMEVVDSFLEIERTVNGREISKPVEPIIIEKAEVL